MRELRRLGAEGAVKLDVFGRVREMIFATDDVADLHLDIVDHVDEVEDPRPIRTPDRHIRMRLLIR